MTLVFGQLILQSKNPKLLGNFFSEILDNSLIEDEQGYYLQDKEKFPFLFTQKKRGALRPSDVFNLYVESQEQLDELKQKISFFCYRHQLKENLFKVIHKEGTLLITDLDGRPWRVSILH